MLRKLLSERPILVGGLGLAASLSLLGGLQDVLADSSTLVTLIALGTGVWWWRHRSPDAAAPVLKPMLPVERSTVETAIAALVPLLETLRQEWPAGDTAAADTAIAALANRRQALLQELDRAQLRVAIAGFPRAGKSTLLEHLKPLCSEEQADDTAAALALTEVSLTAATPHPAVMQELLQRQDAVIYLVTEDLTDSNVTDLDTLTAAGQRVLLALNKQDQYLPDDQAAILQQITQRLQALPQPVAVGAIATAPKPIKVRTHTAEGQVTERLEPQTADIATITTTLHTWLTTEAPHLVAQTVMRQTEQLRRDIHGALNQVRRQQALPLVEQLQWTAAATAFASPVPSLDLLATLAINGQLIMDLGRAYRQPLALDQAKTIASELAAIVVKLGLVEVSTQLLTTALKSHAATYVVGGGVQAFSAAYLTRVCSESLMAYFEDRALSGQAEQALSAEAIGQKLQTLLPRTQRAEFLQTLVKQGVQRLTPGAATAALPPGTTAPVELPAALPLIEVQPEAVPSGDRP